MSAISKRLCDIYESENGPNILNIAANEVERLEAELETMTEHALCAEAVIGNQRTAIEQLESELETAKMERLVADHDLAQERLEKEDAIIRWSRLYEEHGAVFAELLEANAKIEKACRVHSETQGRNYCSRDMQIWPCDTIRALADPAPQEGESATPKPTDNGEDAT